MEVNFNTNTDMPSMGYLDSLNMNNANPMLIGIMSVIVIVFYIILMFANASSGQQYSDVSSKPSISVIEIILWAIFIVLIILNGMNYLTSLNIKTNLKNMFSDLFSMDVDVIDPTFVGVEEKKLEKEVFHIP